MKGDFREAVSELITSLSWLQYDTDHGDIARKLLKQWDKDRGDDWVHETLNEFKEKQNERV